MQKGDTFLMGNPGGDTKHLWIVLSGVSPTDPSFITSNVTSGDVSASPCVLREHEHPWLDYDSAVNLGDTRRIQDDDHLQEAMNRGILIPQVPLDLSIVDRIIGFALTSPAIQELIRDRLRKEQADGS